MEIKRDEVCIFIPTLNEAPTIKSLIRAFREHDYSSIFIMDGNSTDNTVEIARAEGAAVRIQEGRGKGTAIIQAVALIEEPYILMLDGDCTYSPEDADIMLAPLFSGADHVIGNRLHNPDSGALTRLNLFGNQMINYLFKVVHGQYLADILSGYRAFTRDSIRQLNLKEHGFEIETEMAAEAVRMGQKVSVVPVRYLQRPGTETKLNPFKDGFRIMATLYRLGKKSNPLFYFGLIGLLIVLIGLLTGIYVFMEWLAGIDHIPLTVFTVLLVVIGFELFMFGVISDMILTFHREVMREIHHLKPPKPPE